jgi:hypothetical protein
MSPHAEKGSAVVPRRFRISIGGFGGPHYEVRLVNGRLRYQADFSTLPEKISPTAKEWETFWATVQRCDLWNWALHYDDSDICDGTQWEIEVTLGERRLRSSGSNAYPGGEGTGYSKCFRLLLRAVRKLVGGRSFG